MDIDKLKSYKILSADIRAVGHVNDHLVDGEGKTYDESVDWIRVGWSAENIGFGEFIFQVGVEKVELDSEMMSKEFCLAVFAFLLEKAKVTG